MKTKTSKLSAVVMAGIVGASALVGAAGHALFANPEVIVETLEVVQLVEVPVKGDDVIEYVNVTETVTETVTEFVEVDNGDMAFVLERLEDKSIIADAEEIVEELKMEDAFIKGAFDFISSEQDELFDMLEEADLVRDEDEVEVVRVYEDFEDVEILRADFDDNEFKGNFLIKVEDLDRESKFKAVVKVKFEDGEFELVRVQELI